VPSAGMGDPGRTRTTCGVLYWTVIVPVMPAS